MTSTDDSRTLDIAGKFLVGLFAFLALAAGVAMLDGCSAASSPSLCKPGSHEVYIASEMGTTCAVDGTANPCGNGKDCASGCCDAVNGDANNRRCIDDVTTDPNGFCMCAGGGNAACPVGTICQPVASTGYDECLANEGPTLCIHSNECTSGCCTRVGTLDECVSRDAGAFCLN
jgi:hypothetical protein